MSFISKLLNFMFDKCILWKLKYIIRELEYLARFIVAVMGNKGYYKGE